LQSELFLQRLEGEVFVASGRLIWVISLGLKAKELKWNSICCCTYAGGGGRWYARG